MTSRPPLEAKEEADFMKALKGKGLKIRKMNGLGFRAWPDRMVLGPNGFICFVELKRKKIGKLSPGQTELIHELGVLGFNVLVSDDGKEAAEWVLTGILSHTS